MEATYLDHWFCGTLRQSIRSGFGVLVSTQEIFDTNELQITIETREGPWWRRRYSMRELYGSSADFAEDEVIKKGVELIDYFVSQIDWSTYWDDYRESDTTVMS